MWPKLTLSTLFQCGIIFGAEAWNWSIYYIRHATPTSQRTQFVIITKTNRLCRLGKQSVRCWLRATYKTRKYTPRAERSVSWHYSRWCISLPLCSYHFKSNTRGTLSKKHTNPICGHQTQRWNGVGGVGGGVTPYSLVSLRAVSGDLCGWV